MDRTRLGLFRDRKSTDYKYVPRVIEKGGRPRSQQSLSQRIATPCFEGFFRVSVMLPRSHLAIWAVSVYSLSFVLLVLKPFLWRAILLSQMFLG